MKIFLDKSFAKPSYLCIAEKIFTNAVKVAAIFKLTQDNKLVLSRAHTPCTASTSSASNCTERRAVHVAL